MDDSSDGVPAALDALLCSVLSLLCLGAWWYTWHVGGLTAWIMGPMLLSAGVHCAVCVVYVARRGELDLTSEYKQWEIGAEAALVGVWLAQVGAPLSALAVLPVFNGVVNVLNRRYIATEGEECVSLPQNVLSTIVGELAGFAVHWGFVPR